MNYVGDIFVRYISTSCHHVRDHVLTDACHMVVIDLSIGGRSETAVGWHLRDRAASGGIQVDSLAKRGCACPPSCQGGNFHPWCLRAYKDDGMMHHRWQYFSSTYDMGDADWHTQEGPGVGPSPLCQVEGVMGMRMAPPGKMSV